MRKEWMREKVKNRVIPIGILLIAILLCSYSIWYLIQPSNPWHYNLSLTIKITQDNSSVFYLPIIIDEQGNPSEINNYISIISGQAEIKVINITNVNFINYPIAYEIHSRGNVVIQTGNSYTTNKYNEKLVNSITSQKPSLQNKTADYTIKRTAFIYMDNTSNSSIIEIGWKFQSVYTSKGTDLIRQQSFGFRENRFQLAWQEINITYGNIYID